MKKGSHASPEERKRMKEAQLRASAARLSYVTPEQLEACRRDPAWEARQRMADCVVCRECGAKLRSPLGGTMGHLWRRHEMTVRAYRAAYPGARARPGPARNFQ
jgi:predicted transcriptional regulator